MANPKSNLPKANRKAGSLLARAQAWEGELRKIDRTRDSIRAKAETVTPAWPDVLTYEQRRLIMEGKSRERFCLSTRNCIEERRKAECASFGYRLADSERARMTHHAVTAYIEREQEKHLHGVACRYRERLAALAQYHADRKAAWDAAGVTARRVKLDARFDANWKEGKAILNTPARSPSDLYAKAIMARHYERDMFRSSIAAIRFYADLERLAKGRR